jgi:hypothetical protein
MLYKEGTNVHMWYRRGGRKKIICVGVKNQVVKIKGWGRNRTTENGGRVIIFLCGLLMNKTTVCTSIAQLLWRRIQESRIAMG